MVSGDKKNENKKSKIKDNLDLAAFEKYFF